jgi:hypothetical protein
MGPSNMKDVPHVLTKIAEKTSGNVVIKQLNTNNQGFRMAHVLNDDISVQSSMWSFPSCCLCIDASDIFRLICLVQLFN